MASRWRIAWLALAGALVAGTSSAKPPAPTGAICVNRQPRFPAEDGEPDPPMPRHTYFVQVGDRPRVEFRPDQGTLISGLALGQRYRVLLFHQGKRLASTWVTLRDSAPACVGLQEPNALGVWTDVNRKVCGCP